MAKVRHFREKKMPKSSLENKKSLCTQKGETSDLETWLWSFLPSPCHSFTCLCSWELQIGISSGVPNHNACSRCCCSAGPVWAGRRCTCRLWSLLHTRVEGKPRMPSALLPHNHVDVGVDCTHSCLFASALYRLRVSANTLRYKVVPHSLFRRMNVPMYIATKTPNK